MLELALKAHIPIIGVATDDILNYKPVIQEISGFGVADLPKTVSMLSPSKTVYVTTSMDCVDTTWYKALLERKKSLVVVNPAKSSPLLLDVGLLPIPESLIKKVLIDILGTQLDYEELLPAFKGLSLKASTDVVALTIARVGKVTPLEVRKTRGMINTAIRGLAPLDTSYDYYDVPEELQEWLTLNAKYFLQPAHEKLVPRGLLLEGPPGTGKSMAAKAIARSFKCPLYRMDVAVALDRFVGQSEARVAQILTMCEREAPCVLLIDEVEKLFGDEGEAGVTTRILSQLLWWLAEHRSKVFTVMTTNNAKAIPSELYREGRMDAQMYMAPLPPSQAAPFASKVLASILGKKPGLAMTKHLSEVLKAKAQASYSQAELSAMVMHEIKAQGWM